jgi:O-antigen/teichoic acid export membrane protein
VRTIKNLFKKPFIRHNVIFFIGSTTVSILNYLYYPILSRLLKPPDFGEVQTLVSIFTQITIFLSVLGLVTVNVVTNARDDKKRNEIVLELEKLALIISIFALIIAAILILPIQRFLNFASPLPIMVTFLALLIGVPITFRAAFLRGKQDFASVSISSIVAALSKLALSTGFVYLGLRTFGAITGLVFSQIIALIYTGLKARAAGLDHLTKLKPAFPDLKLIAPELRYALLVLAVSLSTTVIFSIDVIAAKHFFPPQEAGLYAGISTIARIIYYIAGPVFIVMLSFVKLDNSAQQNYRLLFASLAMMVALGGAILLTFTVQPIPIIKILIGTQYIAHSNLLPLLSLAMLGLSIVTLVYSYYMALRRYTIGLLSIIGLGFTTIMLTLRHQELTNIVEALLYTSILMLLMVPVWLFATRIRSRFSPVLKAQLEQQGETVA